MYVYMYVCVYNVCMYIYVYVYVYIYMYIYNFTVVLFKPLVPSVYALLYFRLFVYRDCIFHSM